MAEAIGVVETEPYVQPLTGRAVDWSRVKPVEWLWLNRIPIGKLSLLVGEEGAGKGTLLSWLAAQVIQGGLPGDRQGTPRRVMIVGDEDGFEETWVPRLYGQHPSTTDIDEWVLTVDPDELADLSQSHEQLREYLLATCPG